MINKFCFNILLILSGSFFIGLIIIHPLLPVLLAIGSIILFILIVYYPEISFLLFIIGGVYKADERLGFVTQFIDPTLLFLFICYLSLFYKMLKKNFMLKKIPCALLIPYTIIILFAIISLAYTSAPIYGLDKLLRLIVITSSSLILPFYLFKGVNSVNRFFYALTFFSILMILDILSGGLKPGEFGFTSAFGSNYLAVGRIVGPAFIFVSIYYFNKANFWQKAILIPILALQIFGLFISGGRGPVIAVVFSLVATFMVILMLNINDFLYKRNISKNFIKFYSYISVIVITGFVVIMFFYEHFITFFERISLLYEMTGASAEGRIFRYKTALKYMSQFPTIFTGLGIGGFSVKYAGFDDKRGDYPHNIFLEIGSELGLFALIFFIILLFLVFKKVIREIEYCINHESKYFFLTIALLGLFFNSLINASVSGDLNDNRLFFFFLSLIYICDVNYEKS